MVFKADLREGLRPENRSGNIIGKGLPIYTYCVNLNYVVILRKKKACIETIHAFF